MKTETLSIDLLTIDAGTQARVSIHEDTVEEYADLITDGGKTWPFEPLDVFTDGSVYLVADGFHRTLAALRVKRASIPCRVHKGTAKDARIFGMTANDRHGLRMSRADKRHCVEWLLDHGGKMTQEQIAKTAGVSVRTVKYIVAERKPEKVQIAPSDGAGKPSSPGPQKSPASPAQVTAQAKQAAAELTETAAAGDLSSPAAEGSQQTDAIPVTAAAPNTPAADKPPEWKLARSKAKKTVEALMRAIGDLDELKAFAYRETALDDCREMITALDAMK